MTTPVESRDKLDELAAEVGRLSGYLAEVNRQLEPVAEEYQKFVDEHDIGLYHRSQTEDGFRLPSADMRQKLANRAMPLELYGRYTMLTQKRARLVKAISDTKVQVEAQRSILSALKAELEGSNAR